MVAEHLEVDAVAVEDLGVLAEPSLVEPRAHVLGVGVDVQRIHLEAHLAVLLLEPRHERHRAADIGVLREPERADVLLLHVDEVDEVAVPRLDEERRVLGEVPDLELVLDLQ